MFSARKKPQFTTTDVFPLTDAIMDFDDSASEGIRLSRRELDMRRLPGQRTTLQKWLIVICLLCLYLMVVVVFHALGMVQPSTVYALVAMMGSGLLLFLLAFRSGLNRRLREKRLKFPIVFCALTGMLAVFYLEPVTQIVLTPFAFVALAYGMYRIRRPLAYLLGGYLIAGYAAVVGLHYWEQQNAALLRLELMHLLDLGAAVPAFVFLIGKVQLLHHILHRANRKIKNIQEDAQRDTLLGCYNRRYIVTALEEQQQLADETGIPLCLAVIDLDHFKRINDALGHLGGDEVLRAFARVAQENVRAEDIFGRYGGEEFLLIFPGTALLPALNTCERIRAQVEAQTWKGLPRGRVTVSIGVTQYVPGESVLEFFSRADTATYLAKEGGRNQVVVEEPTRKGDPSVTVQPVPDDGEDSEPAVTVPTPLPSGRRYASG
ncbi:MAG: GGDEF domain-containing protein [Burkholderiales bacterium]|nr:GGDEF domain-containing protein [Burkholderiales bacterium]